MWSRDPEVGRDHVGCGRRRGRRLRPDGGPGIRPEHVEGLRRAASLGDSISKSRRIERGKHLAESLGECVICHGANMGGGRVEPMGPLGTVIIPNVTSGGRLSAYSDGELARLIRHGIKRDGHTVRLMPAVNNSWWPDEDLVAVVSYVRSLPPVDGDPGVVEFKAMAKVLDRFDSIPIDQARRIDHVKLPSAPPPRADSHYGSFVATSCRGCHGTTLAGGPIPGAPPGIAVPLTSRRTRLGSRVGRTTTS